MMTKKGKEAGILSCGACHFNFNYNEALIGAASRVLKGAIVKNGDSIVDDQPLKTFLNYCKIISYNMPCN